MNAPRILRARFRGIKAERARGARSIPSLSTLARTPPLPRERVWGFWCAPRRSEGPREAKFPFNSLSNAKSYPIKNFGSNRADKSENFPVGVFTPAGNPEYLVCSYHIEVKNMWSRLKFAADHACYYTSSTRSWFVQSLLKPRMGWILYILIIFYYHNK